MKKILIALSGMVMLASCKKDKVDITEENLIGNYKVVTAKVGGIDFWSQAEECLKDDIQKLMANGIYEYDDAGVVCDIPGDETGNWELVDAETLSLDGEEATILSFDGTTLVVEGYNADLGANAEIALRKQ
jgi:hypothetical protein